jgi:hypothetical protein
MSKLKDFSQDKRNANKGTARGQKQITGSIQRNGFGRSIVADKNRVIVGGNKTIEASAEVFGVEVEPIIIESNGSRPIIHVRTDLNLDDPDPNNPARRLAYEDNMSSWFSFELDPEVVTADMGQGFDFEAIGVNLEELGKMWNLRLIRRRSFRRNGGRRWGKFGSLESIESSAGIVRIRQRLRR